jgi:L-lactate utilization protein LutC
MSPTEDITKYKQLASDQSIETAKKALESHGFDVKVVDSLEAAKTEVLNMIPKGSEVFTATSTTNDQAGISTVLNDSGDYKSTRKEFMALWGQEDKAIEMRRIGSASDYVVGSVHAVTEDGQAIIASASGSQLPNYVFGANHVIWVVSTKKIVPDLNAGIKRIEDYVLGLEDKRALEAYGTHSSLNKMLIYRKETNPHRITIIFVKADAGF